REPCPREGGKILLAEARAFRRGAIGAEPTAPRESACRRQIADVLERAADGLLIDALGAQAFEDRAPRGAEPRETGSASRRIARIVDEAEPGAFLDNRLNRLSIFRLAAENASEILHRARVPAEIAERRRFEGLAVVLSLLPPATYSLGRRIVARHHVTDGAPHRRRQLARLLDLVRPGGAPLSQGL